MGFCGTTRRKASDVSLELLSKGHAGNWERTAHSNPRTQRSPFGRGAYVAALDSPLGGTAVYSLCDGLEVQLGLPTSSRILINLPTDPSWQKKGQSKDISLLLVGIPRATEGTRQLPSPTTEVADRFYRDFGMDGGKTGYTLETKEGSAVSQRYILDVDGTAGGCFSGALTGDLISSLPITVSGLNDRWERVSVRPGPEKGPPRGRL